MDERTIYSLICDAVRRGVDGSAFVDDLKQRLLLRPCVVDAPVFPAPCGAPPRGLVMLVAGALVNAARFYLGDDLVHHAVATNAWIRHCDSDVRQRYTATLRAVLARGCSDDLSAAAALVLARDFDLASHVASKHRRGGVSAGGCPVSLAARQALRDRRVGALLDLPRDHAAVQSCVLAIATVVDAAQRDRLAHAYGAPLDNLLPLAGDLGCYAAAVGTVLNSQVSDGKYAPLPELAVLVQPVLALAVELAFAAPDAGSAAAALDAVLPDAADDDARWLELRRVASTEAALGADDSLAEALFARGLLWLDAGCERRALKLALRLRVLGYDSQAAALAARVALAHRDAETCLDHIAAISDATHRSVVRGDLHRQCGRFSEALDAYRLAEDSTRPDVAASDVAWRMGRVTGLLGDDRAALAYYERALTRVDAWPAKRAAARAAYRLGRLDQALVWARQAGLVKLARNAALRLAVEKRSAALARAALSRFAPNPSREVICVCIAPTQHLVCCVNDDIECVAADDQPWLAMTQLDSQVSDSLRSTTCDRAEWWHHRRVLESRLEDVVERLEALVGQAVRALLNRARAARMDARELRAELSARGLSRAGKEPQLRRRLCALDEPARGPVAMALDDRLQRLPFEALPSLREAAVTRIPSLTLLQHFDGASAAPRPRTKHGFYVVDPDDNLPATKETLHRVFESQADHVRWVEIDSAAACATALAQAHSLFVYCGHGAGERYLGAAAADRLAASALLMGCSSGRSDDDGGLVHDLVRAGCAQIVANLWDVSDRDMDRLTASILDAWALGSDTGAPLSALLPHSRQACKLKLLNGAAPVCFALPPAAEPLK